MCSPPSRIRSSGPPGPARGPRFNRDLQLLANDRSCLGLCREVCEIDGAHLTQHGDLYAPPLRPHGAIEAEWAVVLAVRLQALGEEDGPLQSFHNVPEADLGGGEGEHQAAI